jgi:glutamine synthetase
LTNAEENGIILRSPDNTCNPYFAFGLVIYACLEGAVNGEKLCEPVNFSHVNRAEEDFSEVEKLPQNLAEAVEQAENSEFLREHLPENLLEHVIDVKERECAEYNSCEDKEDFETKRYFYKL